MDSVERLGGLVLQLVNAGALEVTVNALQGGTLARGAGSATRGAIAGGRQGVEQLLKDLDITWSTFPDTLTANELALMMNGIAVGARIQQESSPTTEVVWTGPAVEGSYLRATRQVVQDVIQGTNKSLLVVGYWLAGKGDNEGIINDVIVQIAGAVERGVRVTIVLDKTAKKKDGNNNLATLKELWPPSTQFPKVLTWDTPAEDAYLKLHAKVLVADDCDALITSANLTMYAMDKNIEMGVRVSGIAAARIAQHFALLRQQDALVVFE